MTKGNDGTGNIVERDNWQTPQALFNELNNQYKFDRDCCAIRKNAKCLKYYSDFLEIGMSDIHLRGWMNPPFSKALEMFKHFFKVVPMGVAIYRCDNLETAIWQDIILPNCDWILIPKGRISYEGKTGKGSRFPSALIGFGLPPPKGIKGQILFQGEIIGGTKR